jgi:RNA 3'-terminal phosphate cyclase (ATP)
MERAGFYPKGGGEVRGRIEGATQIRSLRLEGPGELRAVKIVSAAAKLPGHVRQRQAVRARVGVEAVGVRPAVHLVELQASSPGSVVAVSGVFENVQVVTTALGARGKPAESVGEEAAAAFCAFIDRPGAVDEHLADQIVLPLALAAGESVFTTTRITRHLVTNVEVIRLFLDREISVEGDVGDPGRISIQ